MNTGLSTILLLLVFTVSCTDDGGPSDDAGSEEMTEDHADADREGEDGSDGADGEDGGDATGEEDAWGVISSPDTNYLIITTDDLYDSALEIMEYRQARGYSVSLYPVSYFTSECSFAGYAAVTIKENIIELVDALRGDGVFHLLLLGDATESDDIDENPLPAYLYGGNYVNTYSDNFYGDFDDDGVPEIAVGRIPANSNDDVMTVLGKIEAYETGESAFPPGTWNRRITLVAGNPGFGEPVDTMIESAATQVIFDIPYSFDISMTYDREESPYFYPRDEFNAKVYERVNDGAFVFAFIGHGSETDISIPFDETAVSTIDPEGRPPLFFIIACLTGKYTMRLPSLSEEILFKAGKIPAVFASAEVSHPAVNALITLEMKEVLFKGRPATIGEAVMNMKYNLEYRTDDSLREIIATLLQATAGEDLDEHVDDHNYLYNLLGDPALELRYPGGELALQADRARYAAGDTISVAGRCKEVDDGEAIVTFEHDRDLFYPPLEEVPPRTDDGYEDTVKRNYDSANNFVIRSASVTIEDGSFEARLQTPFNTPPGTYYIKAYAGDDERDEFASIEVLVENP
ncbi:MAG: C25 family cysteine peptidase [Pseudomonadota bacterium]